MNPEDLLEPVAHDTQEPGTIRLAYDRQGSGPDLVFVHGLTFDRTSWQPITGRLAGEYRCTAIDLPGHGDSDGPPPRWRTSRAHCTASWASSAPNCPSWSATPWAPP